MENRFSKSSGLLVEEYSNGFFQTLLEEAAVPMSIMKHFHDETGGADDFEFVLLNKAARDLIGGKNPLGEKYNEVCKHDELGLHLALKTNLLSPNISIDFFEPGKNNLFVQLLQSGNGEMILLGGQKNSEEKAAVSDIELGAMLDTFPGILLLHDLKKRKTVYANQAYRALLCGDPGDPSVLIEEEILFSRIHPDSWAAAEAFLFQIGAGDLEEGKLETKLLSVAKGWINVELKAKIFKASGVEPNSHCLISVNEIRIKTEEEPLSEAPLPGYGSSSRSSILLVGENADKRDQLKRLLSAYYQVVLVNDINVATRQLKQFLPDLVLVDCCEKENTSHHFLRAVKENKDAAGIPVIIISSKNGEETRLGYVDDGADDYLQKPFSARELLSRISLTIKVAQTRRHSERNLRNIIMQAPVGIVILQRDDLVVEEVNDNYLKIVDMKRESFKGKPFFESLPYLKPHLNNVFSAVLKSGTPYTENELMMELRRYGKKEKCYFNIVYHPLKDEDNSITGIMGVVNEITGQVIMRKEVEESEKRFKAVADTAPVMIWMTNHEGKCTFLNKPWADFTGIALKDGLADGWTAAVHPEDKELASETFRKALKSKDEYTLQFRLLRHDGTYRWIYDHAVPRFGNEGDFLGYIGSAIDIHEQKASREELEVKVARRTMQLFNTNLELRQSNEQLEQFAYVASHDLQEPLRKIKTYAKLIESSGFIEEQDPKMYLSRIVAASSRMSELIKDILNYSKLSKYDDLFTDTNLNKIIENILTDFELVIHEKKVAIECDKLPIIKGIPLQLGQLFTNLIGNSIKFSSDSPKICISAAKASASELIRFPQLKNDAGYWKISVKDNGIGFDQKYSEKIFTIFQRLNSKSEYEGTGIGLALCRKIVANHKGLIYANGTPGSGAEFNIFLPV